MKTVVWTTLKMKMLSLAVDIHYFDEFSLTKLIFFEYKNSSNMEQNQSINILALTEGREKRNTELLIGEMMQNKISQGKLREDGYNVSRNLVMTC